MKMKTAASPLPLLPSSYWLRNHVLDAATWCWGTTSPPPIPASLQAETGWNKSNRRGKQVCFFWSQARLLCPHEFIDLDKMGQGMTTMWVRTLNWPKYIAQELGWKSTLWTLIRFWLGHRKQMRYGHFRHRFQPERGLKRWISPPPYKNKQENSRHQRSAKEDSGIYTSVETVNKPEVKMGIQAPSRWKAPSRCCPIPILCPIAAGDGYFAAAIRQDRCPGHLHHHRARVISYS